jgi:hypothetical protein
MEHVFKLMTAQSRTPDAVTAIDRIADALDLTARGRPDFIALHFGAGLRAADLQAAALAHCAGAAVHGGTSCLGIMSQDGVNTQTGAGVGALAIWDAAGSYGTASADLGKDAEGAARATAMAAVRAAGRMGEIPDFVWLTVAPGREEQVLAGLRAVFGDQTPIFGGSSADNDVSGKWAQFGPDAVHADGVVISALFPSAQIGTAYQSGYAPTGASGTVTKVQGRRLIEIDHRPAAEVYHEWTGGAVPQAQDAPRSILQAATLWPLGRITRKVAGVPFHLLAHPAMAQPGGALDLFADVSEGDQLWQMQGSANSLVARAGRVAERARGEISGEIAGALVVYCGGCMLSVRDRMDEVQSGINTALGGVPWLGVFTFGEQGQPVGGKSKHGNLMISCTVLGR